MMGLDGVTINIKVVSNEEAETCAFVVCVPASYAGVFDDDVIADCALCGLSIRHRPHVPKRPRKICFGCATANPAAQ